MRPKLASLLLLISAPAWADGEPEQAWAQELKEAGGKLHLEMQAAGALLADGKREAAANGSLKAVACGSGRTSYLDQTRCPEARRGWQRANAMPAGEATVRAPEWSGSSSTARTRPAPPRSPRESRGAG